MRRRDVHSLLVLLLAGLACLLPPSAARADEVSRWTLDGTLDDQGPGANHGTFVGDVVPTFVPGHDSTPDGALSLDGLDDLVVASQSSGLPIFSQTAFSVALWVKGLPQADKRVFSEGSSTSNTPLFNIGTDRTAATGKVDIYIRTATGAVVVNHVLSQREAFDGLWHHLAWVDDSGQAVLYIDGVRDGTTFTYSRPAIAFDSTSIGGIQRLAPCCFFTGEIDDVRLYDHPLSEAEVQELLPGPGNCPAQGDTHCDVIFVEGPADVSPGQYTATAIDAEDESGDPIRYTFAAERTGGPRLTAGPQSGNSAVFDLTDGEWTVSVTVDDDLFCSDQAADATCSQVVVVGCPLQGDTHCKDLTVSGPPTGGPGLHTLSVLSATDDSGDLISYTFRADNGVDPPLTAGPQANSFVDFFLKAGDWTITAAVDDSSICPDAAADSTCTALVSNVCPASGDTHLEDLALSEPPERLPGTYRLTATGSDEGGDAVLYTFTARRGAELPLSVGPGPAAEASFTLSAGDWTLTAAADDDPNCADQAADVSRSLPLSIPQPPARMVSRWSLDETLEDGEPAGNHGAFQGDLAPLYAEGHDLNPLGAVSFDGLDDLVAAEQNHNLPIYANRAYTVALWVKGGPQADKRVYSEGTGASDGSGDPLLYTFVARDGNGRWLQAGPDAAAAASFVLRPGRWTLSVTVDDDLACRDRAADAACSREVEVLSNPQGRLVSHWKLDGDLVDSQPSANDGTFTAPGGPTFGEDRDGNASAALALDGVDDFVLATRSSPELPLFYNYAFSVALWVKGGPQPDRRVYSEASRTSNNPLFNIGTQNTGATGQVDIYIRNDANAVIVNHVLSTGIAFDNAWHHLAWVDDYGEAVLYIDGARDATNFSYPRPTAGFTVDTSTIGGILRAAPSHFFMGSLDDVRVYDYPLSEAEVRALLSTEPPGTPFKRGDADGNGSLDISDPILNLEYQFLGGREPRCLEALDDDDSGQVEISDPIYNLTYQFLGGPPPLPPGVASCGLDAGEELGCESYTACN